MEIAYTLFARYMYTMIVVIILARVLYYRYEGKNELLFTYVLLSAIISLLCILISRVEISLGFALGIFAIFGIVRYRTTQLSPREMTYLFLCAGTAAKNILAPVEIEFWRIVFSDFTILIFASVAEYFLFRAGNVSKIITYTNLKLIHPEKLQELKDDLITKYGISKITDIKVGEVNEHKGFAKLTVSSKDKS